MGNSQAKRYLNGVKKWIADVAKQLLGIQNYDINSWKTEFSPKDLPQQEDHFSCGVFMCAFANLLTDDIPLGKFSREHLTFFRRKLCLDILNRKLSFKDNPKS
jgi:Ulp1 family protease